MGSFPHFFENNKKFPYFPQFSQKARFFKDCTGVRPFGQEKARFFPEIGDIFHFRDPTPSWGATPDAAAACLRTAPRVRPPGRDAARRTRECPPRRPQAPGRRAPPPPERAQSGGGTSPAARRSARFMCPPMEVGAVMTRDWGRGSPVPLRILDAQPKRKLVSVDR